jgi:hypothetical protein
VMLGARAAMVGWAEIRGCARISDALVLARDDVVESRFVVLSDSEDNGCDVTSKRRIWFERAVAPPHTFPRA